MIRRYQLDIIVRGTDRASGPLGRVHGALMRIAHVATGVIVAHGMFAIAGGIRTIAENAFEAYTQLELMEVSTQNLIARELARAERLKRSATATEELSGSVYTLKDALSAAAPLAESLTHWVEELGIRTPFEESDVLTSFRIAAAYGFMTTYARELATEQERIAQAQEDGVVTAQRLTRALTDVIAGSGLPPEYVKSITIALGQVQAKGKLAAQEIHQLVNAGIGIDLMADSMNMTVGEFKALQEEGGVLANEFIPALVTLFERDFGGAADRIMNTLGGITLSLKTIARVLLRDYFGPVLEAVTPKLKKLFEFLADEETRAKAKVAGDRLLDSMFNAADFATRFRRAVQSAFLMNEEYDSPIVLELPFRISGLFIDQDAYEELEGLLFDELQPALDSRFQAGTDAAASGGMQGALVAMTAPTIITGLARLVGWLARLNWIGIALIGAGAGLGAAWKGNFMGIQEIVGSVWNDTLLPFFERVKEEFQERMPGALSNFKTFWKENIAEPFSNFAVTINEDVWPTLEPFVQFLIDDFFATLENFDTYFGGEAQEDWDAFTAFWTGLGTEANTAYEKLLPFFEDAEEFIALLQEGGNQAMQEYIDIFVRNEDAIGSTVEKFEKWIGIWSSQEMDQAMDRFDQLSLLKDTLWTSLGTILTENVLPPFATLKENVGGVAAQLDNLQKLTLEAVIIPGFELFGIFMDETFLPVWVALDDLLASIFEVGLKFVDWVLPIALGELGEIIEQKVNTYVGLLADDLHDIQETLLFLEGPVKDLGRWLDTTLRPFLITTAEAAERLVAALEAMTKYLDELDMLGQPFTPDAPSGGGGGGFGTENNTLDSGKRDNFYDRRLGDRIANAPSPYNINIHNNTAGAAAVTAANLDDFRRRRDLGVFE